MFMTLVSIFTDHIRPDKLSDYEELIAELAAEARKKKEAWRWTAHQTAFGALGRMRYVSWHESYADLEKHGDPEALFARVLGEKKGRKHLEETTECLWSNERALHQHRPDLSYPQERATKIPQFTSVVMLQPRPGSQAAVEEMLRQIAEAIPKTGEPAQLRTYQALTGDMQSYVIARPLDRLSDLDQQSVGRDLLVKAYGQQEGERIFAAGLEGTLETQREILSTREDLSNPPS
jgi:hypothetical protein